MAPRAGVATGPTKKSRGRDGPEPGLAGTRRVEYAQKWPGRELGYVVIENAEISIRDHSAIIEAIENHDYEKALWSLEVNHFRGRLTLEEEIRRKLRTIESVWGLQPP